MRYEFMVFFAVIYLAAAAYVVRCVLLRRAFPFFELTCEWAVSTFILDHFPPSQRVPLPSRPIFTRRFLRSIPAEFIADPFIFKNENGFFLFVEVLNEETHQGEIGYADSRDGLRWRWRGTVIHEPFHMSYPYVFQAGAETYMVPETGSQKAVFLYRAESFPTHWKRVATLLEGLPYNDASVFYSGGLWWMFVGTRPYMDDTLYLYFSKDLQGPWQPHLANPLLSGIPDGARPGGRVIESDGKLYRFGQVGWPYYGSDLRIYEILALTPEKYEERPVNETFFSRSARKPFWMAHGRHHIDALKMDDGHWLVAADGFHWRLRFGTNRQMPIWRLKAVWFGLLKKRVPYREVAA